MTRLARSLFASGLALLALTGPQSSASAQTPAQTAPAGARTIVLRGHGDVAHDEFLRDLFASSDYLLITRDTVITRNDTVRTKVVVVGATLRLDGTLLGDLISVGGNVFVRPSANVLGETHNIAGGFYPSELAHIAPKIENAPNAPYEIVTTATTTEIVGTLHPSLLELPGIKGLSVPQYDRVNGVTLEVGAGLVLGRVGRTEPVLRGWGTYYSQRGDFGGGAELGLTNGWTAVTAGAERGVVTNERWIRSDISNSLAMLLQGHDYRNYYAADRAYLRIDRTLEKRARLTTASLGGQVEDASYLRAAMPWSFQKPDSIRPSHYGLAQDGTERRPNGRITSAIATLGTEWSRPTYIAKVDGLAELGTTAFGGDVSFARYRIEGEVALAALRHHTLQVEWHFQGPLPGTDTLPYQRWSFAGGSGTLHTFQVAAFPGDRVAFVGTKYTIPLPARLTLPLVGRPVLDLLHYTAMAWTRDVHRPMEQNVGLRLGYRIVYLRVLTDPKHFGDKVKTSVGLTFPRKSYPWEAPGPPPRK
jgi:hypothetical protein